MLLGEEESSSKHFESGDCLYACAARTFNKYQVQK